VSWSRAQYEKLTAKVLAAVSEFEGDCDQPAGVEERVAQTDGQRA